MEGASRYKKQTDFPIVPGMEISSLNGHIIALGVGEPVSKNLTIEETIDSIHHHGGIAIACHPTVLFKGSTGIRTSSKFDAVEVVNASAIPFGRSVTSSRKMALSLGLPQVGGSDAHCGPEIGCAYTELDAQAQLDDMMAALKCGRCQPAGGPLSFTLRAKREVSLLQKRTSSFFGKV
jgi:predicted metal-dependent phosphoesterase TrpH